MKKRYIVLSTILLLIFIGGFYGYKNYKKYSFYKKDAVFLLNFLENNYPYFEVKEKVLNYKFLDHKDEFIRKIARSKNDEDFYKNVSTVMCALQNGHSCIAHDSFYLSQINNKSVTKKSKYWNNTLTESIYFPNIKWKYVQGKYIVIKSKNKSIPVGSIITKFNGKDINYYMKLKKEKVYLDKDFKRNLFYVNENRGFKLDNSKDNVEIIYNGKKEKATIDYIIYNEKIAKWYWEIPKTVKNNITTNILNNDKIAYLKIKSFNTDYFLNDQVIIKQFLKKCTNVDNIIIDIRGNGGGNSLYGDFLISTLSNKKIYMDYYYCFKNTQFMKERFFLKQCLNEIDLSQVPKNNYDLTNFKIFKSTNIINPIHDSIKFKGKIYILVDSSVYSSSEYFADIAKKSKLAQIIGTTTGGDGPGPEPQAIYLPNSKLVVRIAPVLTISSDGTVNEELHTEPDIYIEQDLEDYKKYLKSGLKDIEGSEYDTVYKKTLDMLKK